jgi:RNA polymerase sigma factor (sigma-70 family)
MATEPIRHQQIHPNHELVSKYEPLAVSIGVREGKKHPARIKFKVRQEDSQILSTLQREERQGPEDSVQDALLGLIEAASRYTEEPKVHPSVYLRWRIRGQVIDAIKKDCEGTVTKIQCPICGDDTPDEYCFRCYGTGEVNHWIRADPYGGDEAADANGTTDEPSWEQLANRPQQQKIAAAQEQFQSRNLNPEEMLLEEADEREWDSHRFAVGMAVNSLPERQRRIIHELFWNSATQAISRSLGVSQSTVSREKHAALAAIRESLPPATAAACMARWRWRRRNPVDASETPAPAPRHVHLRAIRDPHIHVALTFPRRPESEIRLLRWLTDRRPYFGVGNICSEGLQRPGTIRAFAVFFHERWRSRIVEDTPSIPSAGKKLPYCFQRVSVI